MPMTVVPLKVALGWDKFDLWAFQKNNHDVTLDSHLCHLKHSQINFLHPNATFNGITAKLRSKADQNN